MTQHDDKIKLQHMLDHAKEAVALLRGKEKSDLQKFRRSILLSHGRKLLACEIA